MWARAHRVRWNSLAKADRGGTMSDRTSDVDSSQSPASGAQPVWNEDRAACWLANADARERQL
jgi:hypothetical protein